MSDSEFIRGLREHVREEARDNEALERIARGEASPGSPSELEAACAPLDDAAVDRIVAKVEAVRPGATVVRVEPSRWRRRAALAAGPLALAAAVALYVAGGPGQPSWVELPAYGVTARGESVERGASDPAPAPRLRVGTGEGTFEVILQPERAIDAPVVAYAFVVAEGGEPQPAPFDVEVAKGGAVRVRGATRALGGAVELRVAVGVPDVLTSREIARGRARTPSSPSRGSRVLSVAIDR
jgi:hypothetical protein